MGSASVCPTVTAITLVASVAIAMYAGWPCSPFSAQLKEWTGSESSYFTTRGSKIFYKDAQGKGKLKKSGTLILLHGFPTMSYDWVKMWPALKENFDRVIAVDFLGFGISEKPVGHNYTIMEQADLISDLLRMLKVKEVHILAHDYGDSVAQELLARHNDRVTPFDISSACLLNGGMFKETNFPRPVQRLLTVSPSLGNFIARLANRYIFYAGLSDVFGPSNKPTREDLYDFWCGNCYNEGYKSSAAILGYIAERSVYNIRWRTALQQSLAPIHVIYGPADPVNPRGFIDFYRKTVPNGGIDVLADGIGHYPQWEDSENVTKFYLQFVSSLIT